MAKYCSNCGKELNENADICLGCGVLVNKTSDKNVYVNNKKNKKEGIPTWAVVLIVVGCVVIIPLMLIVAIIMFAFNTVKDNADKYLDEARDYLNDYVENYEVIADGTIGDTLEIDGVKFTLKDAIKYSSIGEDYIPGEGNEYLVFFFDIENTSNEEKLVTYLNFSGDVDGEKCMPKLFFSDIDGISNLNKGIEKEESISGYVAFEVGKNWENFDLTYRKLISDSSITFYVINEINAEV